MGFLSRIFNLKRQDPREEETTYLPPPGPPPNHPLTNADKFHFLQRLTSTQRHTGRTFYQHLHNVYSALIALNLPQEVCDAGLFHSIYGTEFYAFQNNEITREVVTSIIGSYAESLVWVFCRARPRFGCIVDGVWSGQVTMVVGGDGNGREGMGEEKVKERMDRGMQRDLCWVEIANLGDQNDGGKYDGKLKILKGVIERIEREDEVERKGGGESSQ